MSTTKTKLTGFRPAAEPVKFDLEWLRITGLDDLKTLNISGHLVGRYTDSPDEVDRKATAFGLTELKAEFTAQEKAAGKVFVAACERVMGKQDTELADETHDDSDVFVDNS